jgi:hypothetical protein
MENKLINIEVSIDSLTDSVEKVADYLKVMSREMLISNLPVELHKDQRQLFKLSDDLQIQQFFLEYYKKKLDDAGDDVSSDGIKSDIENKEKRISELYNEIYKLTSKGCINV